MATTCAICLLATLALYPSITDGGVVRHVVPWLPALDLNLILRVDGLSWLFLLLISSFGLLVSIYTNYYMPADHLLQRFTGLLQAFMGSVIGIVMAGNIIQLVFFWEFSGLFSFLLIGYWYRGQSARDAARTALFITAGGGLCLFAGAMLLGSIVGSYDLDQVLANADLVKASPLYLPTLVLILLGVLTKSAQFPFHFWLPMAMSAPTSVSAYLHSATLVKLGIFLLLRLWPVLAGSDAWFWLVGGAGLMSLLVGAWSALFQDDLKGLLAYSTVSHLGLIVMLLGLGSHLGAVAAIFHTVNHATFKASLFMAAGAIDSETGTRSMRHLGGLRRVMPVTTALALIATAAMAGVPLLNGFLSKEMFFAATLDTHHSPIFDAVLAFLAVLAAGLSVAYSLKFVKSVFFGKRHALPRKPKEPPLWMRFPIGFLAIACLAVGMLPGLSIGAALNYASIAVLGADVPHYNLAIWHGFTWPLFMSVIALIGGCALVYGLQQRIHLLAGAPLIHHISSKRVFEAVLVFLTGWLPKVHGRFFPARRLQYQLLALVLAAAVVTVASIRGMGAIPWPTGQVNLPFALLWALGATCAVIATIQAKFHRLASIIFSGAVGLIVCITFIWLSAPDLAITQLLVETVTTILLMLGLRWLPKRLQGLGGLSRRTVLHRYRDGIIAASVGVGLTLLSLAAMLHPVSDTVANFFLANALTQGGGHNVVNVILVDFRSLDTLGEITVLAIVALTIFATLRRFRPASESMGATRQQQLAAEFRHRRPPIGQDARNKIADYLNIPAVLITLLTPFMLLLGLHLLWRGHDWPGGGFAAGIVVTATLITLYMAYGARWTETKLRIAPVRWISFGLLLACLTGLGAVAFNLPFLTTYNDTLVHALGKDWVAHSALLFDLGVFAVVVGSCTLILIVLAHQSLRKPEHNKRRRTWK